VLLFETQGFSVSDRHHVDSGNSVPQMWSNKCVEKSARTVGKVSSMQPVAKFCCSLCQRINSQGSTGIQAYGCVGLP